MKKLFILGIALSLFISCAKEDNAGIPPVNQGQIPSQKQLTTLEADKATVADYVAGKKAKIHGKIVKDGNFSYFKFSDGTLVQIYAATDVVNALPQEKKTKLNTAGQEITVTGTFKDYTLKSSGKVIKELVYENENDLVFGQEGTPQEVVNLEAATATASDYVAEKEVKIHGTIVRDGNHSYFKFSDNTMIQIYVVKSVFDGLSQEEKTKLSTEGQEVTVTGKFKDFKPKNSTNVIKEIECTSKDNLVFGATPNNPQPQPQPQPSQGGVFDFEDLTIPSDPKKASNYSTEGTLTKDGVTLQYKARTSLKQDQTDFSIEGKGLMLTNHKNQNCYIKITFPNGVKEISFDYKTAFAAGQREIILSKDESGQEKIDEFSFNDSTKKTHTIQINATGTYTFYILAKNNTRQFVIDNIKWTN